MRALALASVVLVGGCTPIATAFRCADSAACIREGVAGTCEASHWCSFPDAACDSGRRYGEFAGDGLSNLCVTAADSCGALGEPCCAGTNACQSRLTCTGGVCAGCVTALALGDAHGCALVRDGSVACWGANDHGQLGRGTAGGAGATAAPVVDDHGVPLAGITAIAAGGNHTCALRGDGTVVCWGDDAPVPAVVALTTIAAIAAGAHHTCAALGDGAVWCWGGNDAGQLGTAPSAGSAAPVEVVDKAGAPLDAASVAAGATESCAVGRDHELVCWGSDGGGELGDGTSAATSLPVVAASLGAHVVAAAAGDRFACALDDAQKVSCFGAGNAAPTAVALDLATAIAVGGTRGCARRAGGTLRCWGPDLVPAVVREGVGAIAVSGGDTCSARTDGVDCVAFGDPRLACP